MIDSPLEIPLAAYPGVNGFIPGSRATVMLDVVFVAMFAVVPVLAWSVYLVVVRRNYALHKRVQLILGVILLLAIVAFEIDIRFVSGWRERAMPSPYYGTSDEYGPLFTALWVHLFFAVPTAVLWLVVIARAVRNFPSPPRPAQHSRFHVYWAKLAAAGMFMTAITGWVFYYLAFVA
jgi:uncharacterized membrane protein YozB (DUF420 family)